MATNIKHAIEILSQIETKYKYSANHGFIHRNAAYLRRYLYKNYKYASVDHVISDAIKEIIAVGEGTASKDDRYLFIYKVLDSFPSEEYIEESFKDIADIYNGRYGVEIQNNEPIHNSSEDEDEDDLSEDQSYYDSDEYWLDNMYNEAELTIEESEVLSSALAKLRVSNPEGAKYLMSMTSDEIETMFDSLDDEATVNDVVDFCS